MDVGFIVTIVFLGSILGLFARQALASSEEQTVDYTLEENADESTSSQSHAI